MTYAHVVLESHLTKAAAAIDKARSAGSVFYFMAGRAMWRHRGRNVDPDIARVFRESNAAVQTIVFLDHLRKLGRYE